MTRQVLYISYDGMTDTLGQSQVLPYICGLSKQGYSFTLISCEKPERFEANKNIIEKICLENNIDWQPLTYHKSPPIISTIWDINQIQKKAYQLQEIKNFSLVHCRGYISALVGLALKRRYSLKFLFDMRGLWADEKVDAGAWNLQSPIYRVVYNFFKKKEREFFLNADHTISLTERGKKEIQSWDYMRGLADNITVIPCCADTDLFDYSKLDNQKLQTWREQLQISEKDFVVSYLGSIGTWYMLEEMLDFFKVFKEKYIYAKFLFITHDEHELIKMEADRRGLIENIIIQPGLRNEVPYLLALSSLSLFFIRPTYSKIASSPTKQAEIMAMGIPLICNSGVGDTDKLVMKYQAGYVIENLCEVNYKKLVSETDVTNFQKQKLREGALDYASLEKGIKSYEIVYKKCIAID